MYVIVESSNGHIFGFGLTPKKAMDHFLRGLLSYDGPRLDTRPCSPALYRQALERRGMFLVDCRINRDGVAVCRKGMPRGTVTAQTAKQHQRKRRLTGAASEHLIKANQ
jgi:hypothetical protein